MTRRSSLLVPVLATLGCLTAPPVHPRAVDDNKQCAAYIEQGDLTKADVYCDHALEFTPTYADAWTNKGLIRLKRNQYPEAKELFIKALRYNPEQAQAYNDLGFIYLQENAFGKAHDNLVRALKVNPDYTEARWNLALTNMKLKRFEEAKKDLRTIIAVNASLADPHNALGIILLQEGSRDESVDEFKLAVDRDPNFADAWLNLGNAYAESAKYDEAKDALTNCLRADPDNIPCRNNLPIVNRKEALLEPGLKRAQEESKADNTPQALFALAQTYKEKGLRAEEERAYRKCVRMVGKYAPCHYGLFEIYKEDQNHKDAAVACKNFLKFAAAEEFPKEVERCERYLNSNTF